MNGGKLPTNQFHDINWVALNHASRAPQLLSCNYYVCVCAGAVQCMCVNYTTTVVDDSLHSMIVCPLSLPAYIHTDAERKLHQTDTVNFSLAPL